MRDPHTIILKPRVTEKAMRLSESQTYSFVVDRTATKPEIKSSVEKLFKVKVDAVRTMNVGGKRRRFRISTGRHPDWKKAVVTLKEGFRIDII